MTRAERKKLQEDIEALDPDKRIRKLLQGLEMSQQELADELGIRREHVNRWATGRQRPAERHAKRIGEIAQMPWELFTRQPFPEALRDEELAAIRQMRNQLDSLRRRIVRLERLQGLPPSGKARESQG